MNKTVKTILLGLIVWAIPFFASFFVWDTKINAPSISLAWFYALMSATGAIALLIAGYYQFKDVKKDTVKFGWTTAAIWYVELLLLDLIFLVGLFKMSFADYSHLFLSYLTPAILCILIGYVKK